MAKYRKKPVTVEAEQFFVDRKPWPEGVVGKNNGIVDGEFIVQTPDDYHIISDGDWIITEGDKKYPCKPDIFEQTCEKIR